MASWIPLQLLETLDKHGWAQLDFCRCWPSVKLQAQSSCFPLLNTLIFSNGAHRLLCHSSLGEAFTTSAQQTLRRGGGCSIHSEKQREAAAFLENNDAKSNRHICKTAFWQRHSRVPPCYNKHSTIFLFQYQIPNTNSWYSVWTKGEPRQFHCWAQLIKWGESMVGCPQFPPVL